VDAAPPLWLILAAPLAGALILGLGGLGLGARLGRRAAGVIGVLAVLASAVCALVSVVRLLRQPAGARRVLEPLWTLVDVAPLRIELALALDPLSAVMILVITLVGGVIAAYATGYLAHDGGPWRFFAFLDLFVFAMLLLVLADSLWLVFFGWELVGLCSYWLIGHWYEHEPNVAAGRKAFLTNRVGDWGLLVGLLVLLWAIVRAGGGEATSLNLHALAVALSPEGDLVVEGQRLWGVPAVTLAGGLMLLGVAGKSAQVPLHVWLPDAMAGPTPVSALIHAATMVTAGVYLVARLSFLFATSDVLMTILAVGGLVTALLGAVLAVGQGDLKRVLAYSTISQLGFMVLALGVGAFPVAIFHLVTHACFKACLFLAAGSVIHAAGDIQELRRLGGLAHLLPRTRLVFAAGCLAVTGFPVAAGFYSKDEILARVFARGTALVPGQILWAGALLAAGLTSFYMWRCYYLVFHARARAPVEAGRVHEPPASMQVSQALLAVASIALGAILGWPEAWGGHPALEAFVAPVLVAPVPRAAERMAALTPYLLQGAGVAVALAGWGLARARFRAPRVGADIVEAGAVRGGRLQRALARGLYLDEIYREAFVHPVADAARGAAWFDRRVIDDAIHGLAATARFVARAGGAFDRLVIDGAVDGVSTLLLSAGRVVVRWQRGRVGVYVFGLAAGTVALVVLLAWMG
jgi:NADH-quinone oxidoreductase subunit L